MSDLSSGVETLELSDDFFLSFFFLPLFFFTGVVDLLLFELCRQLSGVWTTMAPWGKHSPQEISSKNGPISGKQYPTHKIELWKKEKRRDGSSFIFSDSIFLKSSM